MYFDLLEVKCTAEKCKLCFRLLHLMSQKVYCSVKSASNDFSLILNDIDWQLGSTIEHIDRRCYKNILAAVLDFGLPVTATEC